MGRERRKPLPTPKTPKIFHPSLMALGYVHKSAQLLDARLKVCTAQQTVTKR